jgi:kynureninase
MNPVASGDALLALRDEFPGLERHLHFISHSLGAMPRGAAEMLERYASMWRERGIRSWEEEWMALPTEAGNVLAGLLGAAPGSVSMHENCTTAQMIALSAVDFVAPRNRLVCTAEDFPSELYLYEGLARRGSELVRVPARDGHRIDVADVVAAIDERTAVVAISHVLFRTAQVVDLAPIVARAKAAGALTVIDAYQSAGTLPFDVTALGVDVVTGGSVKWLCGGPGAGWLYVRPDVAERLEPAFAGWQGHARPFAFEAEMEPAPGAARFLTGTPVVAANYAASAGYEIVAEIGVDRIRENSMRQTALLVELVDDAGFELTSPRDPALRGGSVVFRVPEFQAVHAELARRDIICDTRPDAGIRVGPHFFTTDDEIRFVVGQVQEILESGVHLDRTHAAAGY